MKVKLNFNTLFIDNQKVICADGFKREIDSFRIIGYSKNVKSVDVVISKDGIRYCTLKKKVNFNPNGYVTIKFGKSEYEIGVWQEA